MTMKESDVLISHNSGIYKIRIEGRANFEYGPPLRNLAKELEHETFSTISVNLKDCTGMDSTFMGILAKIGLRAKQIGAAMEIINASASNIALLKGLGLSSLFKFIEREEVFNLGDEWDEAGEKGDALDTAEAVHDAHDTLMDVAPENIPKFKTVVDLAQKDINKLKHQS